MYPHFLASASVDDTFLPPAPINEQPKPPSRLWNGFMVVVRFVYEVVAKVGLVVILGILAYFFFPVVAPACFGAAIAVAGTRLVTKILDLYDIPCLDSFKKTVSGPVNKYKLDLIAFVVSVAISFLSPIAGCVLASATGLVSGFTLGVKIAELEQQREKDQAKAPKPARILSATV